MAKLSKPGTSIPALHGQVRAKAKKSQRYQARFLALVGEEGLEPSKS
jgi:hypothetical protein